MTVLDAYALVALMSDEPAADEVERILDRGDAATSATTLAEVIDRMVRLAGEDSDESWVTLEQLGLEVLDVDKQLGLAAGRLRARHYHRTRCAISQADCIVAEAARAHSRPLATADPHLLDVCNAERIDVVVLPDSRGRTWVPSNPRPS